jgi:hypothetical protein
MDSEKVAFIAGYELALKQWTTAGEYPASLAEKEFDDWKRRSAEKSS